MVKNKLSPGWIALIVVVLLILISVWWYIGTYNGLVSSQVTVDEKWANVQTAYQRRADLIPNLVSTVKAYSTYEGDVLTQITEARASIGSAKTPADLQAADTQLNSALSRLLVVVENYPNLKANENYLSLQDQLEGTENRIKVERDLYNQAVKEYSIKIRTFPTNIVAGIFGFGPREMFQAEASAATAPKVNFG